MSILYRFAYRKAAMANSCRRSPNNIPHTPTSSYRSEATQPSPSDTTQETLYTTPPDSSVHTQDDDDDDALMMMMMERIQTIMKFDPFLFLFSEKNKDNMTMDQLEVLQKSSCKFVSQLFSSTGRMSAQERKRTLGKQFR